MTDDNVPAYTGQETDAAQRVAVWVVAPCLGARYDEIWCRNREEALDYVDSNVVEACVEALQSQLDDPSRAADRATFTVAIERRVVRADEVPEDV